MKKLILLLALLVTGIIGAQNGEKQQFTKNYSQAIIVSSDGKPSEERTVDCRIIFNYNNDKTKIKMYFNSFTFDFTQIGGTTEGATENGTGYFLLQLQDLKTGEIVYLQVFKEHDLYGVRYIDLNGEALQIYN